MRKAIVVISVIFTLFIQGKSSCSYKNEQIGYLNKDITNCEQQIAQTERFIKYYTERLKLMKKWNERGRQQIAETKQYNEIARRLLEQGGLSQQYRNMLNNNIEYNKKYIKEAQQIMEQNRNNIEAINQWLPEGRQYIKQNQQYIAKARRRIAQLGRR